MPTCPRALNMIPCTFLLFALSTSLPAGDGVEKATYLRPAGKQFETECNFTLKRTKTGSAIESVTQRGKTKLTVTARYDANDLLAAAEAILLAGDQKKTATVTVQERKAKVERDGQPAQEFDVPAGVIVTSAPDWTDAWMLCRRYDRAKAGKQQFAGLWMHPVEPAQRLTFSIERQGDVTIEHGDKKQKLDRFTITLRGSSSYAVWANSEGQMIKLVPLPYKENAQNWLVLEGYEKSTLEMRP